MRNALLACLLSLVAVCGHAADASMVVAPDGKPAMAGRYWLVTFHADGSQPTVSLALEVGGSGPLPPVPPVPPVTGLEAKVVALIAGVTDPDKTTTAEKIGEAYTLAAMLGELDSKREASKIRESAEAIIAYYLGSKNKAAAWKSFTDGMVALTAPMNAVEVIAAYKLTAGLLGGGPVPPPIPPTPPVTSAVKALILAESSNQTPAQAQLLNSLRNDKTWSKLVEKVDPQQKTEANQPDPLAQAAVKACGSQPLPRLLLLDAAGSVVGDSLPLPGTFDALKAALTAKGVKP